MTNPNLARTQIQALVKKFKSMSASERKGMNENATRQGYILPLFRALGWNVDNVNEVSPEEKVSRGFVDFSFRIGGIPRYFLETKKASEDLNDPRWVQQAIDYAWTKSVTWALLSDFDHLRVFNAEWKESDPFRAQFLEFDLESYLTDFDRLWWFSREETLAGRLEREADKVGKRIKRLPVTLNLFDDLKLWRSELYKSLRGYNPLYSPAQIDEAVLRLLNRLIFIRTAEDRDVEPMRLMPLLRELEDRRQMDKLSEKLVELFRQFDATYNSELFAPHFSEELYCDRPPLEALIRGLYEKNFVRYNFNALEADVLGTAYEQYLGHVVTEVQSETGLLATASHVDEKRTKRKSQGIYYTPAFVTKYIVQQTVSRWLDEHGYNPSAPPRILDMACGSGSFLIEAFDVLDRFVAKQRNQARGESDDLHDNLRRLELLQSCIFGVDKDKQAVDVARLNLMLRALHGRQKLPLLANIYNADSLRPETWQQAFPEIMHEGGFDVIIGNPPYVRQETLGKEFKIFAQQNFETYTGTADLYVYFIEQAYKELKPDGFLGMIVSNKWMRSNYGKSLRQFLASKTAILEVVDFGELPVFQDASTFPVIIIARKRVTSKQDFTFVPVKSLDFQSLADVAKSDGIRLNERALKGESWTLTTDKGLSLFEKTGQDSLALGDFVGRRIYRGVVTGCNEVFIIDQNLRDALVRKDPKSTEIIKPFVFGDEVRRYRINYQDRYLIFTRRGINIDDYPAIRDYLIPHKERLLPKPKKWQGEWLGRKEGPYQWFEIQDSTKYFPEFEKPKIVYGQFQIAPHFAYCPNTLFFGSNHYMLLGDNEETLLYLCGVLNSKLYFWYMGHIAGVLGDANERGRLISQKSHIIKFPVHVIDFANSAEKSAHDEIVKLVEEMLALQKQYQQADTALEDSRHPLKRRIESLDREIDKRVYALYKLTTAEIKIVEA